LALLVVDVKDLPDARADVDEVGVALSGVVAATAEVMSGAPNRVAATAVRTIALDFIFVSSSFDVTNYRAVRSAQCGSVLCAGGSCARYVGSSPYLSSAARRS